MYETNSNDCHFCFGGCDQPVPTQKKQSGYSRDFTFQLERTEFNNDSKTQKYNYFDKTITVALTDGVIPADFVGIVLAQAQGEGDVTSHDLENLIGRKLTSLQSFLQQVYSK